MRRGDAVVGFTGIVGFTGLVGFAGLVDFTGRLDGDLFVLFFIIAPPMVFSKFFLTRL
jgi:hypothetical protein